MVKDRTQPLVRASALSTFADLMMACQGRYFDRNLHELLLLVNQTLRFDESELARRAAIHLLRSMITSAANSPRGLTALFEVLKNGNFAQFYLISTSDVHRLIGTNYTAIAAFALQ
jgi:hypothetical protein